MDATAWCSVALVIVAIGFLVLLERQQHAARQTIQCAHTAYQDALIALKAAPTSADLRQQALTLGRAYANLTRSQKGVTVYDEMAVMNDLNAATAGAANVAAPAATSLAAPSVEDRLQRLDELRAKSVISDQEFAERWQKILDEL